MHIKWYLSIDLLKGQSCFLWEGGKTQANQRNYKNK
jgi:hypothetical protein